MTVSIGAGGANHLVSVISLSPGAGNHAVSKGTTGVGGGNHDYFSTAAPAGTTWYPSTNAAARYTMPAGTPGAPSTKTFEIDIEVIDPHGDSVAPYGYYQLGMATNSADPTMSATYALYNSAARITVTSTGPGNLAAGLDLGVTDGSGVSKDTGENSTSPRPLFTAS